MACLADIVKTTTALVAVAYKIAMAIRNSEEMYAEIQYSANILITKLTLVQNILTKLQQLAHRVSTEDEKFLCGNVEVLRNVILDTQKILEEILGDHSFIQRLFMNKTEYRRRLCDVSELLNTACSTIQAAIPGMVFIQVDRREFGDFRKLFSNHPAKLFSKFETSFTTTSPKSSPLLTSNTNECFIKLGCEQLFFSYHLRTWSTAIPTETILTLRQNEVSSKLQNKIRPNMYENSAELLGSIFPLVPSTRPSPIPSPRNPQAHIDLSELFMSHDTICGIAVTESVLYIATKHEITAVSLKRKRVIGQYGSEGNGPNGFRQISFLYIDPNDQTSLYIVDRAHFSVYQYEIGENGLLFKYIRSYSVIATLKQTHHLVACAIHNQYLYVSDQANSCLHVFPLKGQRQSFYLTDTLITEFSPGYLCTHGKYLYVSNCSKNNPGILVFNEECQPIDWFRHPSLEEILAIDIDTNINELYILTTTSDNSKKEQPLIVTMNSSVRS